MRVLILGGNGFIGSAVAGALVRRGHQVTALARETSLAARRLPLAEWGQADLSRLTTVEAWQPLLSGIDAVVNCAGALQDSARDDVKAVQETAMRALYAAGGTLKLVVQVSARTDGGASGTAFLATKRAADAALKKSGIPFVILRPALVIGRNAHGGSALLRALAAFPLITPLAEAEAPIQFAALDDVSLAIAGALEGNITPGSDLDIAAPNAISLADAVARYRAWLGLAPAKTIAMPAIVAKMVSAAADLLGMLGWRSPFRSTAMSAVAGGIIAKPAQLPFTPKTLDETLGGAPAGVQDLWFARLYLLKPVIIGTLSLFWIASGAIALVRFAESWQHLAEAGLPASTAKVLTLATSLADIALGAGAAVRRYARASLLGMTALSLAYLAAATILQPALWLDPLGPLVKVLPSIVLALAALAILDER